MTIEGATVKGISLIWKVTGYKLYRCWSDEPGILNMYVQYFEHIAQIISHTESWLRNINTTAEQVYFPGLCIVNNVEEE